MEIRPGGRLRNTRTKQEFGTLGCLVRVPNDPDLFLLSAAHSLAVSGFAEIGDDIFYLRDASDREGVRIGRLEKFIRFHGAGANRVFTVDAAIARLVVKGAIAVIPGIGTPRDILRAPFRGMATQFRGGRSQLRTDGHIISTGVDVKVTYRGFANQQHFVLQFADQILYGSGADGNFSPVSEGGDSGALVLDDQRRAIGLHIGVTPEDFAIRASVCTPIETVLQALGVELVTASGTTRVNAQPVADLDRLVLSSDAETGQNSGVASTGSSATTEPLLALPGAEVPAGADDIFDLDGVGARSREVLGQSIRSLLEAHRFFGDSVRWQLGEDGLIVAGNRDRSPGALLTVPTVWDAFGPFITEHAVRFKVPAELIVATICTESSGRPDAVRIEDGWTSDQATPKRMSAGLMQTLLSSARAVLDEPSLTRQDLLDPQTSIRAGTAFINNQRTQTSLDPPLVACAYNAGSIQFNDSVHNRWRLRQHPIGSSKHVDRFVQWFNDCFSYFSILDKNLRRRGEIPPVSFYRLIHSASS